MFYKEIIEVILSCLKIETLYLMIYKGRRGKDNWINEQNTEQVKTLCKVIIKGYRCVGKKANLADLIYVANDSTCYIVYCMSTYYKVLNIWYIVCGILYIMPHYCCSLFSSLSLFPSHLLSFCLPLANYGINYSTAPSYF